jgi:hypothetical protein
MLKDCRGLFRTAVVTAARLLTRKLLILFTLGTDLLAWGSVPETLTSPYFNEADEDEEIPSSLRKLIDSGTFDENNPKHLVMARDYFESRFCA